MGFVKKLVSAGLVALAASVVLAVPTVASAASGTKAVKKRPVAAQKLRAKRVARVVP